MTFPCSICEAITGSIAKTCLQESISWGGMFHVLMESTDSSRIIFICLKCCPSELLKILQNYHVHIQACEHLTCIWYRSEKKRKGEWEPEHWTAAILEDERLVTANRRGECLTSSCQQPQRPEECSSNVPNVNLMGESLRLLSLWHKESDHFGRHERDLNV